MLKLHISNKNTDVKIFTYTSKEVLNKHWTNIINASTFYIRQSKNVKTLSVITKDRH